MKLGRPRGTRDFLSGEMKVRRSIIEKIRGVFEAHGFEEMDTPAIELWEVLATKGGEEVERQIYKFQDKGGRWLGLRFDLTVPLARVVAGMPDLVKPFKRYNISKVWRYEEPQSGRLREFLQADIDVIGSQKVEADLECISTAVDALKALGLSGFEVRVNDRRILEGMVQKLEVDEGGRLKVFRALDKLDKIGIDGVRGELAGTGLTDEKVEEILRFICCRGQEALDYAGRELDAPPAREGAADLGRISDLAGAFGLDNLLVDFSLVRGLDYYTGPVFEIKTGTAEIGSIAGGGRYDRLIEKFGGPATPATGISLGIERLFEVLKPSGTGRAPVKVFVASVNDKVAAEAVRISRELIAVGIPAETDLMGRRLGRQLEYADSKGIPYVLIVGPEEISSGRFKLKLMREKREISGSLKELSGEIAGAQKADGSSA